MNKLTNKVIKTAITIPLLIALGSQIISCTAAQKKVIVGNTISATARTPTGVIAGAILSTIGEMDQQLHVAREGKPEININYPGATPNNSYNIYNTNYDYRDNYGADPRHIVDLEELAKDPRVLNSRNPPAEINAIVKGLNKKGYIRLNSDKEDFRFIAMKHHPVFSKIYGVYLYSDNLDFNNDGITSKVIDEQGNYSLIEFDGLGKKVFNIDKEKLIVGFEVPDRNYYQPVTWKSWTKNNKLIGETEMIVKEGRRQIFYIGSDSLHSNPKDFLDKIKDDFQQSYETYRENNTSEFSKQYKVRISIKDDLRVFKEEFKIIKNE